MVLFGRSGESRQLDQDPYTRPSSSSLFSLHRKESNGSLAPSVAESARGRPLSKKPSASSLFSLNRLHSRGAESVSSRTDRSSTYGIDAPPKAARILGLDEAPPESFAQAWLRRGKNLKRHASKLSLSSSIYSVDERDGSPGPTLTATSSRSPSIDALRSPCISQPSNFQHVTHTAPSHFKKLVTGQASDNDLLVEFSALRAGQSSRNELRGIKVDDIHSVTSSPSASGLSSPTGRATPAFCNNQSTRAYEQQSSAYGSRQPSATSTPRLSREYSPSERPYWRALVNDYQQSTHPGSGLATTFLSDEPGSEDDDDDFDDETPRRSPEPNDEAFSEPVFEMPADGNDDSATPRCGTMNTDIAWQVNGPWLFPFDAILPPVTEDDEMEVDGSEPVKKRPNSIIRRSDELMKRALAMSTNKTPTILEQPEPQQDQVTKTPAAEPQQKLQTIKQKILPDAEKSNTVQRTTTSSPLKVMPTFLSAPRPPPTNRPLPAPPVTREQPTNPSNSVATASLSPTSVDRKPVSTAARKPPVKQPKSILKTSRSDIQFQPQPAEEAIKVSPTVAFAKDAVPASTARKLSVTNIPKPRTGGSGLKHAKVQAELDSLQHMLSKLEAEAGTRTDKKTSRPSSTADFTAIVGTAKFGGPQTSSHRRQRTTDATISHYAGPLHSPENEHHGRQVPAKLPLSVSPAIGPTYDLPPTPPLTPQRSINLREVGHKRSKSSTSSSLLSKSPDSGISFPSKIPIATSHRRRSSSSASTATITRITTATSA